jgi:sterol desaturase/sphingolipid hydroxylase (fatty acid hydroxylase superfamily)
VQDRLIQELADAASNAGSAAVGLLFAANSQYSLFSLFTAAAIAVVFLMVRRGRGREIPLALMLRAIFPRALFKSASCRADVAFLFLNTFLFPAAIVWIVVSMQGVAAITQRAMVSLGGARAPVDLPLWADQVIATIVLFLAYELAYWCDHALSHRVPFLWEFHRVHHTADRLTPLTNARVHPVDTAVFANFIAVYSGVAAGVLAYVFGAPPRPFAIGDTNVILVVFLHITVHLQHSHFWIRFPGALGRVFMSPAHHQIHHSEDPAHFNTNFGSCLAVWDWLFGTLYTPPATRPRLTFGAGPARPQNHHPAYALIVPFVAAWRTLRGSGPGPSDLPVGSKAGAD